MYEFIIVLIQTLHVTKDLLFEKLIFELLVLEVLDNLQQRFDRDPQLALSEILTLLLPHMITGKGGCLVLHRIKQGEQHVILQLPWGTEASAAHAPGCVLITETLVEVVDDQRLPLFQHLQEI